jgi:hypothetical protein
MPHSEIAMKLATEIMDSFVWNVDRKATGNEWIGVRIDAAAREIARPLVKAVLDAVHQPQGDGYDGKERAPALWRWRKVVAEARKLRTP